MLPSEVALSPRLQLIAEFVPLGSRVVDVGTDHALLPVALLQAGRVDSVVCSDIADGPLDAARANIQRYGFQDHVSVRKGSGLHTVDPGEIDTALIAGMGGGTIAGILEDCPDVVHALTWLVVQPMNAAGRLRQCLEQLSFRLEAEQVVRDGQRVYQVIRAEHDASGQASEVYRPYQALGQAWLAYEFGPLNLMRKADPLVRAEVQTTLRHTQKILTGLEDSVNAVDRRRELESQCEQMRMWLRVTA